MGNRHRLARYQNKFGNHPKIAASALSAGDGFWAADLLRRLDMIFQSENYRTAFFDCISTEALASFMQYPPPSSEPFQVLYSNSLLPTPAILNRVSQGDMHTIEVARQAIKDGKFDFSDPLHIELDYSRYSSSRANTSRKYSFQEFRQVPWIEDQEVVLTAMVYSDISRTAREAAAVFEFIMSKQNGNPLLVIGNRRYGSDFVINPIEERLSLEGVKVAREYIPSFEFFGKNEDKIGYISPQTWQWILQDSPDIIVVDGTKDMDNDGLARFPAAMIGYMNAFAEYNRTCRDPNYQSSIIALRDHKPLLTYGISFWAANMTDYIYVGDRVFRSVQRDGDREAVIVRSSGGNGSNADFDDPEDYVRQDAYGFTSKGFVFKPLTDNWQNFVTTVQSEIKREVGAYL